MSTISASTTSTTAFKITTDTTGSLVFQTGASPTTALTIDGSQNTGIGVTSPTYRLTVAGVTSDATPVANFRGYTTGADGARTAILRFTSSDDANWALARYDAYQHIWNTNGTEKARIDATGNLGLGVTPSAWSQGRAIEVLQAGYGVWNGTASSYLMANAYFNGGFKYGVTGQQASHYYQYQGAHVWSTAASGTAGNSITFTQAMTLDASGNLGVGTTSPSAKLHVNNGFLQVDISGTQAVRVGSSDSIIGGTDNNAVIQANTSKATIFLAGGTERARIDSSGRMTTPYQTGFSVVQMSVTDFNASTGSTACLKGGTVSYNQGSGYDSTTGRFTAPVAGTYVVTSAILVATGTGRMEAALYINGGQYVAMNGTGTTYDGPGLSVVVKLAQSDYLTIGRISGSAYASPHTNTYFSAYLLG